MAHILPPKFLVRRDEVYSVRFTLPKEYQSILGRREVIRSLGTSDLGEALSRRGETLDAIKREITEAINTGGKLSLRATAKKSVREPGATVRATAHRWLAGSDGIKNATRVRYRQHLAAFERFSDNIDVARIDRKLALDFMEALRTTPSERTGEPLSHRSLTSCQSCLASYWRVLDHWGACRSRHA